MRGLDNVICPKCGKEMEKGYIYAPRDIMWADDDRKKSIGIGDEKLLSNGLSFNFKKVPAYRCKDCNIAAFEYDPSM